MSPPRLLTLGLFLLAALQALVALVLADWALPLFGDPPILGAAISRAASQLHHLAEQNPEGFRHIQGIDLTLRWLFSRQSEGVLYVLAAAVAFGFSSIASVLLALIWKRMQRPPGRSGI